MVPEYYWDRPETAGFGQFNRCAEPVQVEAMLGGVPASRYRLYACEDYRGSR